MKRIMAAVEELGEELLIGNIVLVDPSPLLLSAAHDKSEDPLEKPFYSVLRFQKHHIEDIRDQWEP
jgi:hypothetical protein